MGKGFEAATSERTERSGTKSATLFRRLFLMTARGEAFLLVPAHPSVKGVLRNKPVAQ